MNRGLHDLMRLESSPSHLSHMLLLLLLLRVRRLGRVLRTLEGRGSRCCVLWLTEWRTSSSSCLTWNASLTE